MKKIIAFCAAGLITFTADAAILRLDFSGYVGKISGTPSGVPTIQETDIVAGIQGDQVSGSYLIDTSEAILSAFSPPVTAVYRTFESNGASSTGPSFITASSFTVGGMTFSSGDIRPFQITSQVSVFDDPATDSYTTTHQSFVSSGESYFFDLVMQASPGNTSFTNGLGLDQPFSGAFLGGGNFGYTLQSAGINLGLKYTVTNAQITEVSAVPLPAAVWLFGSGLGFLGFTARRKMAA